MGVGGPGQGVQGLLGQVGSVGEQGSQRVLGQHDHAQQVAREGLGGPGLQPVEVQRVDLLVVREDLAVLAVGMQVVLVEQVGKEVQEVLRAAGVDADHDAGFPALGLVRDRDHGHLALVHQLPHGPIALLGGLGGAIQEQAVGGPLEVRGFAGGQGRPVVRAVEDVQAQEGAALLLGHVAFQAPQGIAGLDALLDFVGAHRLLLHDVDGPVLALVLQLDAHRRAAGLGGQARGPDGDQVAGDLLHGGDAEVVRIDAQLVQEPMEELPGLLLGKISRGQQQLFQPGHLLRAQRTCVPLPDFGHSSCLLCGCFRVAQNRDLENRNAAAGTHGV